MDIASLSMNLSQSRALETAGIALLKMNLNSQNDEAKSMQKIMESAPGPENLGNTIDEYV